MTNSDIKQLANIISQKGIIAERSANIVLNKLTRRELFVFSQHLKTQVGKKTVKIISQKPLNSSLKQIFIKKYSGLNVIFSIEKIGDGIVIFQNDTITDLTMNGLTQNTVDQLKASL